ncbi:hypothetical protein [Nocardia amikacinitolerans]|uniref:hypothetical protein n=1 Tax=Nocardia amikacinitolerans TaxID=756689 RepID=UPI0020A3B5EF|nr:hypothetical protein [Nocardia amikacinitolerans]
MIAVVDAMGHGPTQFQRPWPPDATVGIVTETGRVFHRGVDCPGYRQGVANSRRHGRRIAPVEQVTSVGARRRGKGVCNKCWP